MPELRNVAVVSFAQAPIVARDEHRTAQEMLYPIVREALAKAGVERDDIDYQAAGSADYIDGRPFGFVQSLDYTGSWPPRQDIHFETDAAWAAYYAWLRIQAGDIETALVVGYGKTSEGDPERVLNLCLDPFYEGALGLTPHATAALQASALMARTGATDRDFAELAAARRASGAKNPATQLREATSVEALEATPWAVEPLRAGYLPPVGESAVCLLLAAEGRAESMCERPAWIHGVDHRSEHQSLGARDLSRSAGAELAATRALEMAGRGASEIDVAELSAASPAEEMILREALGLNPAGNGDRLSVNPSGGPLCGHPLMLTGLIRLGEAFLQIAGAAGEHQVADAKTAIAHAAQGHCLQQNLVWALDADRRGSS